MANIGTFNGTGADCSGNSGDSNRVLTLSNTGLTQQNGMLVYVSGLALALSEEYTVSHKNSGTEITFLNPLWDDMTIVVQYYEQIITSTLGKLPLTTQLIKKEIATLGSNVTIRSITDDSYSKWGDATESTSDAKNVKCMVNVLSQEDELVKEGVFQSGDLVFWFISNRTDIERGNRIQFNSKWYEIVETIEHIVGDNNYLLEARTKKV